MSLSKQAVTRTDMPTTGTRIEQKERTRQRICEAALSLIGQGRSFTSLSLREITREAGIVPAAFYRHFSDMDQLGLALVEMGGVTLRRLLREARRDGIPPTDMLRGSVLIYKRFVEERSLDSLASVLGGKFTRAISTNWGVLTPHFQFEWEHEFNSDPGAATARFVNDPTGTEIELSDAPYDADFYRIGLGLSAIMSKGRSGFLYYEKTIGRDGISQDNLALGMRLEF